MSVLTDYGLKDPDVEFLLAVHQIEQNPTEYDNTDVGKTVANVTSIREASDLTRSQIDYRVSPGDGGRGFGESGMNFLRTYEATIEGSQITDDARGSAPGAIPTSETSTGSGTAELEFVVRDGEIQLDYTITLQGLNFDKVLRGSKNADASSQTLNKLIGLHLHTNVRGRLGPVSFAVVGQGDPQTTVTRGVELSNGDLVNTSHLIASNVPASRPNRAIAFNPGIAAEGLTGDSDRTLAYNSANNELTIEGTWTREEGDAEGLSSARAPAGDASIEPADGIEFVTTPAQMAQRIVNQNIQPGGDTPFSLNHHTAENLNGEMRGQIVATQPQ